MEIVTTICASILGTCIGFTVRSLWAKKKSKHASNAHTPQPSHSAMQDKLLEEAERVSLPHNSCLRIAGQVKSSLFEKGV